jgi:phenylalanine-4-hydroxylase
MSVAIKDSTVESGKNRYLNGPRNPDYTIDQAWASYSAAEHNRWDRLFKRSRAILHDRACDEFISMMHTLKLSESGVPNMERLSDRLEKITGWRVVPVAELVPDEIFFNHLANRRFPAGAFIRSEQEMDYLQEPDIFHDVFGHVPLLANPVYSNFMQAYGQGGQRAISLGVLPNLARLYWYTVEFGLIRTPAGLRIFGAGIMSSTSESERWLPAGLQYRGQSAAAFALRPARRQLRFPYNPHTTVCGLYERSFRATSLLFASNEIAESMLQERT